MVCSVIKDAEKNGQIEIFLKYLKNGSLYLPFLKLGPISAIRCAFCTEIHREANF
jgi:hypothetical protein